MSPENLLKLSCRYGQLAAAGFHARVESQCTSVELQLEPLGNYNFATPGHGKPITESTPQASRIPRFEAPRRESSPKVEAGLSNTKGKGNDPGNWGEARDQKVIDGAGRTEVFPGLKSKNHNPKAAGAEGDFLLATGIRTPIRNLSLQMLGQVPRITDLGNSTYSTAHFSVDSSNYATRTKLRPKSVVQRQIKRQWGEVHEINAGRS
ncbi:hypothetical protein DFH08DRAFT_822092 [Mycena albidolilacea]|uniref:Uncharacterized protein n=1 Tax=Mycena albidolilacea TaxID=1033008 RepID=A0AAD7ECR8_9AGAR|nr:hypothetical protein DFH08DRAFT_822092 [Mycena albidolilacea]